jgi:hypothetical protein
MLGLSLLHYVIRMISVLRVKDQYIPRKECYDEPSNIRSHDAERLGLDVENEGHWRQCDGGFDADSTS